MRDKIAATLAGVDYDGHPLDAHEFEPRTVAALQAWPVWVSTRWLTRCTWEVEWAVVVVLPAAETETWTVAAEALVQPVRDALETIGHVEQAEPFILTISGTGTSQSAPATPVLRFTLVTPTS